MKRPYSREFPFTPRSKRYLLDGIPATLWIRAHAKAKRHKLSFRALLLRLLTTWVEEP